MSTKVGGWTCYSVIELNPEVNALQLEIIKAVQPHHVIGAVWVPTRICTQVVAGTNFRITYLVTTVTHPPTQKLVEVTGFRALDGTITITSTRDLTELSSDEFRAGAFTPFRLVTESDLEVFEEAKLLGVRRKPLLVSTQLVNGVNYAFICVSQKEGGEPYIELVMIYKPFNGKAKIVFTKELIKLSDLPTA
ncbi:MAG: hypothetical protein AB8G11_06685 [Saprospiraceae bacterium]